MIKDLGKPNGMIGSVVRDALKHLKDGEIIRFNFNGTTVDIKITNKDDLLVYLISEKVLKAVQNGAKHMEV